MGESRFSLTVYIAPPFSAESDVGHMWISLDDNQKGLKEHYGFHPEKDGRMYSKVGSVRTDDGLKYTIIQLQKIFPITEETYHNLRSYCQKTLSGTFGILQSCWQRLCKLCLGYNGRGGNWRSRVGFRPCRSHS